MKSFDDGDIIVCLSLKTIPLRRHGLRLPDKFVLVCEAGLSAKTGAVAQFLKSLFYTARGLKQ